MDLDLKTISISQLKRLVDNGIVKIDMITTLPISKKEQPEYKKYQHLANEEISISEASRKYDLPKKTLSQWKEKGYIDIVRFEGNRILLNEQDVAYCAEIRKQKPGSGRWLFNPDGSPYIKST